MSNSTQDFLSFDQIREGIIILKNKGLRSILMVSSLNFALKSTEEQNAILYQFQNFLNSLDFSCQILVLSRRLNITGYLDKLEEIDKKKPLRRHTYFRTHPPIATRKAVIRQEITGRLDYEGYLNLMEDY